MGGSGIRVRVLGGDRAGEIRLTRFLRNEAVVVEEMVATASARTSGRCAGRHVLALQDTTTVRSNFSGGGGLQLHPTLAVDADDGAVLGLVEALFLQRSSGRKGQRKKLPFSAKESRRWLEGTEAAGRVCAAAACITMIADRESDIYEIFALRPASVELLIRAAYDRARDGGGHLFAHADSLPEAGRMEIELPAAPGRRARKATLALRFTEITLNRPRRPAGGTPLPKTLTLNLVDVREVDPPAGRPGAHWRLLTTHAVNDLADARRIAGFYRRRWAIEQLFRTLKTKGFDVEALRIAEDGPREKLVMAALVAAVTVLQLVHARDGAPPGQALRPLADAFDPDDRPALEVLCIRLEGKTERQKNPHPPGTLAFAAWVCARLGGWNCYYGKPGPIVMLNGWIQFQAIKHGWSIAQQNFV